MAHWIIMRRDNDSEYLNLELATKIIHRDDRVFLIYYVSDVITVEYAEKPATYAHICAYLGIDV